MSQPKSFSLILLYDKMSSSLPVAQALKEKNIDVQIAQNAGELIQSVAARNIDLVGLSVNHASTRSLIQVLREKTRIKILIFGEDKSSATAERVDDLDADFKVNGVATAYNVWMKIAQAVKFKMKEADNNGNILYSGGKTTTQRQDAAIIVKSNKADQKYREATEMVSSNKKKKKQKQQVMAGEDEAETAFTQRPSATSSDVMYFKKDEKQKNSEKKQSIFKKNSNAKKSKGKSDDELIEDEVSALENMFKDPFQKKSRDKVDLGNTSNEALAQGGVTVDDANLGFNGEVDLEQIQKEESQDLGSVRQADEKMDQDIGNVVSLDKHRKAKLEKKRAQKEKAELNQSFQPSEEESRPFRDIVLSAAHSSYAEKEASVEGFGPINKMTVVPVDKNRDRGFLIFCTSDNQFVTSGATPIDLFKKSLQDKLGDNDAIGIGESYNIETEEIDLQSWVRNESDFHVIVEDPKSQKQILICFISKDAIYPDTNKSIELNMLKVELEVIPILTPINFNVFLYFARNKRLIPYLRRGGKLTEAQMQRLGKHGVDTIYISEADRKALYSFFISQTIHQDLRPIKKAA